MSEAFKRILVAYQIAMVALFIFGAWLVWNDPTAAAGGWASAIFAAFQLILSKIGELARLRYGAALEDNSPENSQGAE